MFNRFCAASFLVLMSLLAIVSCGTDGEECPSNTAGCPEANAGGNLSFAAEAGDKPIVTKVGMEYAAPGLGAKFGEIGAPAVKYLPGLYDWGVMQPLSGSTIKYTAPDSYVTEYQGAGFKNLMMTLKIQGSSWALKNKTNNFTPTDAALPKYKAWVKGMVERYDGDKSGDAAGLKYPVTVFEVGPEFSSFDPEPVADYLAMLSAARTSAREASTNVKILHSAFLPLTAFKNHPGQTEAEYRAAFNAVDSRIRAHNYDDLIAILARPELFDGVNFHALGDAYEIEETVKWLKWEMGRRGYSKPIYISDTAPNPLSGYGWGNICLGDPAKLPILVWPAVEADRCRLASFFSKLAQGDAATLAWTQGFAASDMAKKVVIAMEQGIEWINTSFMEDNPIWKIGAAAGISGWAGMALTDNNLTKRTIKELRPLFYSQKQLAGRVSGYGYIRRITTSDPKVRAYRLSGTGKTPFIVAWYEPGVLILPGDAIPSGPIQVSTSAASVTVERLIDEFGRTTPVTTTVPASGGIANVTLTPTPVYILGVN